MNELSDTILIVDDNEDDVYALKRAFRKANVANPQQVVTHGQAAVDYLSGNGKYSDRSLFPLPFVVFLDLNTPFLNGFEVFTWIRTQPSLHQLQVVILTGSIAERDDRQAAALGARTFLVKPPTPSDLQELMRSLASNRRSPETPPST